MPLTLVITDFDGTLTPFNGEATILSPVYQSLFTTTESADYTKWEIKDSEAVQKILKDNHKELIFITPEAVSYLNVALAQPDVRICIVSRNREDYIREVLKYHEIEHEKITILDCKSAISKYECVKLLADPDTKVERAHIFDDDRSYSEEMAKAVKEVFKIEPGVTYELPGGFDWEKYQKALELKEELPGPAKQPFVLRQTSGSALFQRRRSSAGAAPAAPATIPGESTDVFTP